MKGELGEKGVKGLRGPARYVFLLKQSYQVTGIMLLILSQKIQNSFKSIRVFSDICLNLHKFEIENLLLCLVEIFQLNSQSTNLRRKRLFKYCLSSHF